uniref:SP110 nuclear body protein n=1 Tax=Rhinolophus ferrumequinum TaxID=59479 RepID=A0A671F913_RHIFE
MFTATRALEEALLQHFMYQKLEISYAIYKPFPFFEGLRDKSFITESMYRESLEACSNLVPVSRVVYNILTKLEKTFNLSFLELLFSQINLREYPNLMKIFKSFRSVVSSYGGWNRNTPILLEVPANPAERSSCQTLLPLLPPQRPPVRHPTPARRVSELRVLAEPSRPAAKAFSSFIQEGRTIPVSSDNLTSQTKGKEDVQHVHRASSAHGSVVRNDAPEPNDPEEPQEASSTLANKKGTTSLGHGTQEKLQVVNQATQMKNDSTRVSKIVTRAQKAKTECAQTSGPEENKKKKDVHSSLTRTCQKTIPQKKKNEAETVDFLSPELPVTCGEAKGILYKEKMGKGSSEKCIQNEEGVWLTPREFEIAGKGTNSGHWKRHVVCGGQSIEKLMKKGLLLCPPRINLKREWENADECEVCCKGGSLLCCNTCPRAFHEDCHIPPAEADRSPWSCTFCRMEASPGSQDCHKGSEVLERQMRPEQQLKCEFLLLKAYCHPQSSFFAETPLNIRDYAEPFKEAMWLDLVKERLTEKVYTVAWFVRDMRLIFRNHKTFYKASDLGQVGLDLEATFEKDLKELLSFHDTGQKSSQAPL